MNMDVWYLRSVYVTVMIFHCTAGQPVFNCPRPVAYGDSAVLNCSIVHNLVNIKNPKDKQVVGCTSAGCEPIDGKEEKINITRIDNTVHLTVQTIVKEDDGEWTCESGSETARCSLYVYKLPSCKINSTSSTNSLTIGQDLTLNIRLSNYYCTNSIAWNLHIGDRYQNITELWDHEETDNITNRVVTYSPAVTSSLTGRVELTFNCNSETYDVNCKGVDELKLRDPPSCNISSTDDTGDLIVGTNLTLEAAIEEYPCRTGIKYALLSGPLMVTEFLTNNTSFYATFEVRPEYLGKKLYLQYTCNKVSAITNTTGVEILLSKDLQDRPFIIIIIIVFATGLPAGGIGVVLVFIKRSKSSIKVDALYSDVLDAVHGSKSSLNVPSNETYTEVRVMADNVEANHSEADRKRSPPGSQKELSDDCREKNIETSRPKSVCIMVPNEMYVSTDELR